MRFTRIHHNLNTPLFINSSPQHLNTPPLLIPTTTTMSESRDVIKRKIKEIDNFQYVNNPRGSRSRTPKTATATNNKPSAANNKPTMTSNKHKSNNITNDSLAVVPHDDAAKAQRTGRRASLRPRKQPADVSCITRYAVTLCLSHVRCV